VTRLDLGGADTRSAERSAKRKPRRVANVRQQQQRAATSEASFVGGRLSGDGESYATNCTVDYTFLVTKVWDTH
jgi:hypothetical protein